MTVKTEQPLQDGSAPEYVYHDRTTWCCAVFVGKRYGSKGYPQRNAAHVRWTLPVTSSSPLKQHLSGGTLSWWWRGGKSSVRVVQTETTRILRRRFPGTCETVGQVFKFVWRLRWKCCLYVIIHIRFFSITICNLLMDFPSYFSKTYKHTQFQYPYHFATFAEVTRPAHFFQPKVKVLLHFLSFT